MEGDKWATPWWQVMKRQENKGIGWLAALELSTSFFSSFARWNAENPVFFLHFSCWEGILKVSFCTAWANSKIEKIVFRAGETILFFFITLGKQVWKLFFINNFHVLTAWAHLFSTLPQACGKFFQDWTSDGSIMPPLEASRPFPTIFVGSPHGICLFGQKR